MLHPLCPYRTYFETGNVLTTTEILVTFTRESMKGHAIPSIENASVGTCNPM
jgi:hypothetical protein